METMNLDVTEEERDLLIDALEVYREFLGDQADEALDDPEPGGPDFTALDDRAKTLILRLEVAHQRKDDPTPLKQALQELAEKETTHNETEARGSSKT